MKQVLIICYYWPPAGGPGVQRWLKFVKYLPQFGIEPILFVPDNAHYPIQDSEFEREVSEQLQVIRFPIKEPYKWAKLFSKSKTNTISKGIISSKKPSLLERFLLFVRGNYFIPDARVGWVKPSVSFLRKFLHDKPIETIITTGPPHSLHLIGLQLKQALNVKWVADFRDPWTSIHYHKDLRLTDRAATKHRKLEAEVLQNADHLVVTSWNTKKEFESITKRPISVITNGYDISEVTHKPLDAKFSLVHTGSLLNDRNPELLWSSLQELIKEQPGIANDLEIRLVGAIGVELKSSIEQYNLEKCTVFVEYVSHQEAMQYQAAAQLLLLIEMDREETKAIIPGKIFEYLSAQRPVIAIGPAGSDVSGILAETKAGEYFLYSEKQRLKQHILEQYIQFKNENLVVDSVGVAQYHRKNLTEQLANLLKNL